EVPGLKIGADRSLAFPALVDGDRCVVGDLEEGDHTLAPAIGTVDVAPERPDVGPVITDPTTPLRQKRVIADGLEDLREVITNRRQVTGGELRVPGAGVEDRGCRGTEAER